MVHASQVLPVGGIKEKTIAARRANCHFLVFPYGNKRDFEELPDYLKEGLEASESIDPPARAERGRSRNNDEVPHGAAAPAADCVVLAREWVPRCSNEWSVPRRLTSVIGGHDNLCSLCGCLVWCLKQRGLFLG